MGKKGFGSQTDLKVAMIADEVSLSLTYMGLMACRIPLQASLSPVLATVMVWATQISSRLTQVRNFAIP